MLILLGGHGFEQGRRAGIGAGQAGGEFGIDATILFLGRHGQGQNFALGQAGKAAAVIGQEGKHRASHFGMVLNID
ncbi:hypothetical protein D3C86_2129520 [compost metagenome]